MNYRVRSITMWSERTVHTVISNNRSVPMCLYNGLHQQRWRLYAAHYGPRQRYHWVIFFQLEGFR